MSEDFKNISWPGWETVRLIGRGSFGAVYEIERKVFDETEKAALKVISIPQNSGDIDDMYSDGYDEESITSTFKSHLQSIVAEYSLMRKMNGSANIVNCDDVRYIQHDDGIGWDIFIKMELLTPLTKALSGNVDEETVIKIAKDMCGALELCKKHGIVHRDIKPQNIFVSEHGDYKLGDFGIAKTVEKTTSGTMTGSPRYIAPEVYHYQPYGHTVDIYSLGLVLYWLLNGLRMPFMPLPPEKLKAGMEEESRNRRLSGEKLPEPAHGSKRLKQIVLKACAYDPKERYQTAAEMLQDIENAFGMPAVEPPEPVPPAPPEPEPGPPVPPTPPQPENKKKSKLPVILGIAAVIVVVIILLLLRSCDSGKPNDEHQQGITNSTTTEDPEQLDWSDWVDKLPDGVNAEDYVIEEQVVYRSSTVEDTTTSTTQSVMDGWEMYHEAKADSLGLWSEWSPDKPEEAEGRVLEEAVCYRYRSKEITTGNSSSKAGWTLDKSKTTYTFADYPSTWKRSTTEVTATATREVKKVTVWKYKDVETTTSTDKSLAGWTRDDSKGIIQNWGASQTTTTKPQTGDGLRITATTQTGWGYYHYCNYYYNGGNNWNVDSIQHGSPSYWHGYTSSFALPAVAFQDQGGQQAYGGTGSGAHHCDYNFYIWFRNPGADTYTYTYQTCTPEYHFYKWPTEWKVSTSEVEEIPGKRLVETETYWEYRDKEQIPVYSFWRYVGDWSQWGTEQYTGTESLVVEKNNCYRYSDTVKETTYYFRKWSNWEDSEWTTDEIVESETVKVQKKTQYRYKSKGN